MYKLFLEATKKDEKAVLLYKDASLIDEIRGNIGIVSSINDIIRSNGLSKDDIGEVSFKKGPGSYTGLKMTSSISNTLNWIFGRINIDEIELPDYGSEPNITKPKKPQTII